VKKIKSILIACARGAAAVAFSLSTAVPVSAADWSYKVLEPPASFAGDFGLRLWLGHAKTAKNLYDTTGTQLLSRLTYDNFTIFTGETYSRFDFNTGWFLKGYVGGGALWDGKLKDEDFPPGISPYSATLSAHKNSSPAYGSVDGGFKLIWGPDFHVGLYAGYHFLRETMNAYGCGEIAANPEVCTGGIPDVVKVITQVNNWHSVRVGVDAAVEIDRLKLSLDAAFVPYAHLSGADAHWLRIDPTATLLGAFTGPVPEDGHGWGYQLDGFLSYRVNDVLSIGAGGRYWHMETKGLSHFEGHVVGVNALPQVVKWKTDNFGVFLQTSVKLGPYPLISNN
jgi:outer membrane protease